MQCPRCHQDNPPHARFCLGCGTPAGGVAASYADLKEEFERLRSSLTEGFEQQTATSEILRVISSSTTDTQPVFDAIVRSAARLCDGLFGSAFRFDGERLHRVAHHNLSPAAAEALEAMGPLPLDRESAAGKAILERAVVHVPDIEQVAAALKGTRERARLIGMRAVLVVPMLREGRPVGTIVVGRRDPVPFTARQIELLKTFADQAVIAIENVRLFNETKEALEQQTATAEILRAIAGSPTNLGPTFAVILDRAMALVRAQLGVLWRCEGDEVFRAVEAHGAGPELTTLLQEPQHIGRPFFRTSGPWKPAQILDVRETEPYRRRDLFWVNCGEQEGMRTLLNVPLVSEARYLGAISLWRREVRAFTEQEIALLQTFADQAVIAIENVRLFTELQEKNRALTEAHAQVTEALDQQTATSEILRVISSSPTDLQPVMDTIAESAARLCSATDAAVRRVHGEFLQTMAVHGPAWIDNVRIRREVPSGRAVLDAVPIHVHDTVVAARDDFPGISQVELERGSRTMLAVPLLREGVAIGVITIRRQEVRPFTDINRGPEVEPFSAKQIELLETFANQAVIAIENVRLFNDLRERTAELTRSVEQLTALGEVSRAVSSTLDVETVLQTIVMRANEVAGTAGCTIWEYDERREEFRLRPATTRTSATPRLSRHLGVSPRFPRDRGSRPG